MAAETVGSMSIVVDANVKKFADGMASCEKSLKKLSSTASSSFNLINKAMQIGVAIGSFSILKHTVDGLTGTLKSLAEKGEAFSDLTENFQRLGGSASELQKAKVALLGTVSATDLMTAANAGLARGIPGFSQNFSKIAELGGRYGEAMRIGAKGGLDALVAAMVTAKPKMLAHFGIFVTGKTATENQRQAIEQLTAATARFAPMEDTAAKAMQAYEVALGGVSTRVGVGVNQSDELRIAFRELTAVLDDVDWKKFGTELGNLAAQFIHLASVVLPPTIDLIEQFGMGLEYIFQTSKRGQLAALGDEIQSLSDKLNHTNGGRTGATGLMDSLFGTDEEIAAKKKVVEDGLRGTLVELQAQYDKTLAKMKADAAAGEGKKGKTDVPFFSAPVDAQTVQSIAKFREAWNQEINKGAIEDFRLDIKNAIEAQDSGTFERLKQQLGDTVEKGFKEKWQAAIDAGAKTLEEVNAQAAQEKVTAMRKVQDEYDKQSESNAKKVASDLKAAYREAVDYWGTIFDDLLSGKSPDWKEQLKDMVSGFGSSLFAGMFGSPNTEQKGVKGMGEILAQEISDYFTGGSTNISGAAAANKGGTTGVMGSIGSSIASYFGSGNVQTMQQASDAGLQGPPQANGLFSGDTSGIGGMIQAGMSVVAAAISAGKTDKKNKDNSGTGAAVGGGLGLVGGFIVGGPMGAMIGEQIGQIAGSMLGSMLKWGPQNAESKARHKFANYFEDQYAPIQNQQWYGAQGTGFTGQKWNGNLLEQINGAAKGSTAFNQPGWAESMDKWGDKAKSTFIGLGEAIKDTLGITEDVGAQIGDILGTSLAGNIDNARLMVIQLGLSFGDLSAALLKEAKNGAISWHEYNVEIAGVAEAFKPGLEAVGAYGQAFKNLIDSAGQGMQSVKSFKDIAVEAQEAGVTSMDELKKRLLAGGMDPEYVNALFASAAQRGITTLDQWANASDETSGAIVGDMEAMSKKLADQWEKLRTSISDLTDQINAIPTEVTSNIKLNITSTLDDNAKKVLDSGIGIKVPTSTITGPSVSGSVKSFSSTSNAAANVLNAQPMSITINAQGAGAGVENTIRRVLVAEMPNITNSILNNYSSGYQRG